MYQLKLQFQVTDVIEFVVVGKAHVLVHFATGLEAVDVVIQLMEPKSVAPILSVSLE